jgi:hypothetical protein
LNCTSRSNNLASACREVDRPQPVDRGKASSSVLGACFSREGLVRKKPDQGGKGGPRTVEKPRTLDEVMAFFDWGVLAKAVRGQKTRHLPDTDTGSMLCRATPPHSGSGAS